MVFKVLEKPEMTDEELAEFNASLADEFREGLEDGSTVISDGSWEETVRAIKAKKARNASRMTSFRLPVWVIEGLKRNAAKGGVKFSEFAIETLSKAAM
nr:MAG TPA: antitoxin [Caudoviricetes sp.]